MNALLSHLPGWKAGLLAATWSVPPLLILYFLKLRRREMEVSSTLLWRKAIQDLQVNAPFQRLRRNLLLFLQLLLLVLLCAALARPIVHYKPGAGKLTVILIDRSASMQTIEKAYGGGTRLEEAKRRARDLVDSMRRGDMAVVIAFDDSPHIVCPYTTETNRLRAAIDSIEPTDRYTRLKDAYKLAESQAFFDENQKRPDVKPDVFLYSDGRVLDADQLSLHGQLHYEMIGTPEAANIAIVALGAKRNYERPTEVQVFARLGDFGPEPEQADVQLTIDGQIRGSATVFLVPDRWTAAESDQYQRDHPGLVKDSIEFPHIEIPSAAVIRIEQMHKEGDCLAADDAASVVVPPAKALSVLLVTQGNYYLERMIDSLQLKNPDRMLPRGYEDKKPTQYDLIIFDAYQPQWLPPSGNFISFGAVPPGLMLKAVQKGEGALAHPVLLGPSTVLDWKRDHPILEHISLSKVYAAQSLQLDVPVEGDDVLVEGTRGPMIVLERQPRGTFLVVSFDLMNSNWPLRMSFPHFMHNALQYLAIGTDMDVRQSYTPGSTVRISRADIDRVDPHLASVTLAGPMGIRKLDIPRDGDLVLPALDKVGLYTLDPPIGRFDKLAVNLLDANESNVLPGPAPGDIGHNIALAAGQSRRELWWWFVACGALPLVLVEWWVYTRRVSS